MKSFIINFKSDLPKIQKKRASAQTPRETRGVLSFLPSPAFYKLSKPVSRQIFWCAKFRSYLLTPNPLECKNRLKTDEWKDQKFCRAVRTVDQTVRGDVGVSCVSNNIEIRLNLDWDFSLVNSWRWIAIAIWFLKIRMSLLIFGN